MNNKKILNLILFIIILSLGFFSISCSKFFEEYEYKPKINIEENA